MSLIVHILLLPIAIAALIYAFYHRKFKFWAKLGIPHTTPTIPYGNVQGVNTTTSIGECVTKVYHEHKDKKYVGFWTMFRPNLLIIDPDIVKDIFVRDFMSFHDRGANVNETIDPLAGHLFSIGGAKWRNLRVKMTPTFTSGKMKLMFPIFVECVDLFKTVMDTHADRADNVDVKELCACFTTDVISLCAFGVQANSLTNPQAEFRKYGRKFLEPSFINGLRGLFAFQLPKLHKFLNMRVLDKESSDFFLTAFRDSIKYREQNNIKRNDFLDLLMQLLKKGKLEDADTTTEQKESADFTFEEAAAQAFVFFAAGFETSSTTMQFALYELAKNVELQKKCRAEIKTILKKTDDKITYDVALQQDLISRVISETLRKYPPVPFLQRECNKEYVIPNTSHVIPKGTMTIVDVLGMHRDEKHYPNPERFDPDRFLDEEKSKRHHFAYLPFGEGPRNCIGMRFGLLQTKVGLMMLLNNYEFNVVKETPIPLVLDEKSFILNPKTGMVLKVSRVK